MCELAHIPWAKYLARSEGRPGKGQYRNGLTRLSHHGDRKMTSPYLEQPFVPVVVALPQMAEQIQAELAGKKLAAADQRHLRQRAELIRWLLTPAR